MAAAAAPMRLYIGNLPASATTADIYALCQPFGKVNVIELIYAAAFVDFADPSSVDNFIATNNEKDFHGSTLHAEHARLPLNLQSTQVHIFGLPESTTEHGVTGMLQSAGAITKVEVLGKEALVTFASADQALTCVQTLLAPGSHVQGFVEQKRPPRTGPRPPRRISQQAAAGEGGEASAARRERIDVPFSFLVPIAYAGALIGTGGAVIKSILQSCSARVILEPLEQPVPRYLTERLVQIKGALENVCKAFQEIVKILEGEYAKDKEAAEEGLVLKAVVPSDVIGHIIGRSGAYIKQIKSTCGGSANITACEHPGTGTNFQLLVVDAPVDGLCKAQQLVLEKLTAVANSSQAALPDPLRASVVETVTLLVPNNAIGSIIGQKGAVVRDIGARSHAAITVDKVPDSAGEDTERRVVITGTAEAIELAQHMISSCLQQKGVHMKSLVSIPASVVGHVIGKRGSRINDIIARSRASLDIKQEEGSDKADVIIEGSVMNMVVAQRMVLHIVETYA